MSCIREKEGSSRDTSNCKEHCSWKYPKCVLHAIAIILAMNNHPCFNLELRKSKYENESFYHDKETHVSKRPPWTSQVLIVVSIHLTTFHSSTSPIKLPTLPFPSTIPLTNSPYSLNAPSASSFPNAPPSNCILTLYPTTSLKTSTMSA